jgi:hypothetical protein
MKNIGHDKRSHRLHERIGVFVSRGQYRRALEVLDQVILNYDIKYRLAAAAKL